MIRLRWYLENGKTIPWVQKKHDCWLGEDEYWIDHSLAGGTKLEMGARGLFQRTCLDEKPDEIVEIFLSEVTLEDAWWDADVPPQVERLLEDKYLLFHNGSQSLHIQFKPEYGAGGRTWITLEISGGPVEALLQTHERLMSGEFMPALS
ncbi:MAG: hypothetical protein HY092_03540 [Candidatus Kerfeldbacteria bacterium]|nr:hypothetical protein [Candidatus Kerfeldbacteria bacterium]